MAFSGMPYQLFHTRQVPNGSYVRVDGPNDTFGVVMSSKQVEDGRYLHQIRGVKERQGEHTVANF